MVIIIRRPYAYLEPEFRGAFEGQEDVEIIIDRRFPERRTGPPPISEEWPQQELRRPKEVIVEVVVMS